MGKKGVVFQTKIELHFKGRISADYSYLSNKRGGWNKCGGSAKFAKSKQEHRQEWGIFKNKFAIYQS